MSSETNSIDQMPKKSPLSFQVDLKKFEKATDEEKRQQDVMSESVSFFKDGMRKLMKNPLAVGSIIVLIAIIAMILIVPHVVPYKYSQIITVNGSRDKTAGNMAPFTYSEKELAYMAEGGEVFPHIMGTDSMGRDYFIRVIYGTRVSLTVGLFAAVIVLLIGVVYGSVSGYFGGKVDMVMMRIVDIIYSLPDMLMVVLLSVVLREIINVDAFPALQKIGTNMISMFIVFALLYWTGMARMVRGQILTVKQNEYILAARVSGAKDCSRAADSVCDLYRELLKLYRSGRAGSDAVSWFPCKRGKSRNHPVSLQTVIPCRHDLFDHPGIQPVGRWPAGCI